MNTAKTIIISTLTYYFLSFLGPFAILLLIIGLWAGMGYIGFWLEKRYSFYSRLLDNSDMFIFLLFGPTWMFCAIAVYWNEWTEELREIKDRAFPKE